MNGRPMQGRAPGLAAALAAAVIVAGCGGDDPSTTAQVTAPSTTVASTTSSETTAITGDTTDAPPTKPEDGQEAPAPAEDQRAERAADRYARGQQRLKELLDAGAQQDDPKVKRLVKQLVHLHETVRDSQPAPSPNADPGGAGQGGGPEDGGNEPGGRGGPGAGDPGAN